MSSATGKIRMVLLDPGCWNERGFDSPYLQIFDGHLQARWGRKLENFSVRSRETLLCMLDAVTAIADVAYIRFIKETNKAERSRIEHSARDYILRKFGWKVELYLDLWNLDWGNELVRCVAACFANHIEPPSAPN
jgi:hypothetical protein